MTSTSPDSSQSDGITGTTRSVSVDCAETATGACRVGVLSPHNSKETKAILNAVRVPGIEDRGEEDVLGYTTRIRIHGRDGTEKAVAKSDTGAKRTSIDTDLAGQIAAGPMVGTTEVRSGTGSGTETRPLVDVDLCLNGRWRTVTASITDRSEMTYSVLLGRDVLEAYNLDISQTVEE